MCRWVNRKDPDGRNIFAGGFLGLDNIGIFDRSKPLPTGGFLEQVCLLEILHELQRQTQMWCGACVEQLPELRVCSVVAQQADGTAWMAFFATCMLDMALELAVHDPVYEDMASKFFEHFISIADAMNNMGDSGE